jgi:uncharacterized protein YggE
MTFRFVRHVVQATLSLLAVLAWLPVGLLAEDGRNGTIASPGHARASVAADVLKVVLLFETQSTSFAEAKSEAEEMQSRLQSLVLPIAEVRLTTEYDFDTLKQRGFYWKKGSKVEHRITLRISALPPDSLHATLASVVDQSVALSPKLTITDATSEVSETRMQAARMGLLAEAVRDARANAEVIAKESGLAIVAPRAIYATQAPRGPFALADGVSGEVVLGYNLRESFTIRGGLREAIELSVYIAAEYSTRAR